MESVGCKVIFLPPYSPDLNPIEKFWANIEALD
nr:transposase [Orientia tsutsugamushi]